MIDDEIVAEVREARRKHAERFDFDLRRIYEDLKKQEKASGRTFVRLQPKPVPSKKSTGTDG